MMACEGPEFYLAWFDTPEEAIAKHNLALSRAQWDGRGNSSPPDFESE